MSEPRVIRKEEVETINQADALSYSTDKMLKEMKGKLDSKKVDEIKKHNEELKKLLEKKNPEELKKKMEEMNKVVQEATTELYKKAAEAQQQASAGMKTETKDKKEKVVDADFEVEDEKK